MSLLLAGRDENGPQLYQIDPSGSYFAWKASAIGKNYTNAKTFLEKRCVTCPCLHVSAVIRPAIHAQCSCTSPSSLVLLQSAAAAVRHRASAQDACARPDPYVSVAARLAGQRHARLNVSSNDLHCC